ncbi:MAG: hypothetical protein CVU05_06630 [Bacteroidetes bacterium HGW-Bacteroidetes-21]|jgi:hypothetical protein|nr:MAG: hypothetical protein CVU05_06630 [Bacteroidetes bacterium HGW-Bacteroidetes-21]
MLGMKKYIYGCLGLMLLTSCDLINPKEEVPAYFRIKEAQLVTDEGIEGANTSKINDIWVNIDGNRQGTYELPSTFPVLATGSRSMVFRAGIKVNGIAASRQIYPFFDFYEFSMNLEEDSIYEITPIFHYKDATIFTWLENFEDAGISMKKSSQSDTIMVTQPYLGQVSNYVGYFAVDDTRNRFLYETVDSFPRPASGTTVYLELEYESDDYLTVGLKLITSQYSTYEPVITLYPHPDGLNKIYIELGSFLTSSTSAVFYSVYFSTYKQIDAPKAEFYIDNIKLLRF